MGGSIVPRPWVEGGRGRGSACPLWPVGLVPRADWGSCPLRPVGHVPGAGWGRLVRLLRFSILVDDASGAVELFEIIGSLVVPPVVRWGWGAVVVFAELIDFVPNFPHCVAQFGEVGRYRVLQFLNLLLQLLERSL